MDRLTTNKEASEMSMVELAHNSCYAKENKARYRDYGMDIDVRELTIGLLGRFADIPNEFTCDDDFDDFMLDSLQYGMENMLGLIAVFYRNLWAMANLRERLKEYEDLEEQGLLLKSKCKPGDIVWEANKERNIVSEYEVTSIRYGINKAFHYIWALRSGIYSDLVRSGIYSDLDGFWDKDIGKTVFLTQAEAEEALIKMKQGI